MVVACYLTSVPTLLRTFTIHIEFLREIWSTLKLTHTRPACKAREHFQICIYFCVCLCLLSYQTGTRGLQSLVFDWPSCHQSKWAGSCTHFHLFIHLAAIAYHRIMEAGWPVQINKHNNGQEFGNFLSSLSYLI